MKKLIVLLLAFAMVGAVSAQVTTAINLSGGVTLVNEAGQSIFARDGSGYDTITFKGSEKDGKYGFSIGYNNVLNDLNTNTFGNLSSWNAWYKGAYAKITVGNTSNGTFRAYLAKYWKTAFGRASYIAATEKYGISAESTTLGDLIVGVYLPVPEAATNSVDMFKNMNFGVKYTMKDVGFAQAYVDLHTGDNKVSGGFTYTGVKNFTGYVATELALDATKYSFGVAAKYTGIDKLALLAQASDIINAGANSFDVYAEAGYDVTDAIFASAWGKFKSTGSAFSAGAFVDYSFANGLTLEANGSYDVAAAALAADLTLYYGVSF